MGFISIVHIIMALVIIVLVLVQDSKGGGMGGAFGGGGSSSLLGPTGAPSLLAKITKYAVIVFAITSIWLSNLSSKKSESALDLAPATTESTGSIPSNPQAPSEAPQNTPANQ